MEKSPNNNRLFFNTIRGVKGDLQLLLNNDLTTAAPKSNALLIERWNIKIKLIMQSLITIGGLVATFIIFFAFGENPEKIKFAWFLAGTLLGYWIR